MLETKPQSVGNTARAVSARSSAHLSSSRSGAAARPLPPRQPSDDMRRQAERAARRAARSQPRGSRMTRSEARLLTWTVTSAVVVCGLLVLYLAAYAHLTMLGIEQSKAKHELHDKWQQNQMLRAQEATLKSPDRIAAKAVKLGLTKDSPHVDYIRPVGSEASLQTASVPILPDDAAGVGAFPGVVTRVGGEGGSQRTNSGPKTEDNLADRND